MKLDKESIFVLIFVWLLAIAIDCIFYKPLANEPRFSTFTCMLLIPIVFTGFALFLTVRLLELDQMLKEFFGSIF